MFTYLVSAFYSSHLFSDLLSMISISFAIFIITTKNPIVSVLFLILLFSTISVILILMGAVFIGISYLLVYVGAVSILFLFILMLINIRVSELINETNNNVPLAILTVLSYINPINIIIPHLDETFNSIVDLLFKRGISPYSSDEIYYVSSSVWDSIIYDSIDIITIGNILYTSYFIYLIITSIILLLAMVGAIIVTIKQKNV